MSTDADLSGKSPPSFRERGGWWVLIQFILMAAWVAVPPAAGNRTDLVPLKLAAALMIAAGAFVGIAGAVALKGNRTPFPRPRDASTLIEDGIYAVVRHPLYVSLMLLAFGWACLWQSAEGAALAVVQAVFFDAKARCEERFLRARFPGYAAYAAKVRRFIPGIY